MSNIESQVIRTEYSDLMKKSYIDYAMSVNHMPKVIQFEGEAPIYNQ